jgi:hypothetical protein
MDSYRSLVDYNIFAGLIPVFEDQGIEPQITAEQFAMDRRRQHVAHEVGHTLGFPHNFISATLDRASVMDYPFPLIEVDDQGNLDISNAYRPQRGVQRLGGGDVRLHLVPRRRGRGRGAPPHRGGGPGAGPPLQHRRRAAGSFPEVHQWVEGATMFEALDRTRAVRRLILDHFDERVIRPGEPMAWLNQRLAHAYLHHRYSVEAVVKYVGGARHYRPCGATARPRWSPSPPPTSVGPWTRSSGSSRPRSWRSRSGSWT